MKLSFSEKFLLALYLEYFDREYNVNDDRIRNVGSGIFNRHTEMQNICYLCEQLGVYVGDYGFIWDWLGPESSRLKATLDDLDKKEKSIDAFYEDYNRKRSKWFNNYNQQLEYLLSDWCRESEARKIALSSFVLKDVMASEDGSVIMAGMIYLYKHVLPSSDKPVILSELEKRLSIRGIKLNKEIEEFIWNNASILDMIEIKGKHPQGRMKTLNQ